MIPPMSGRLLVISHVRVRACGGRYYLLGGFGRHIDAFAERFEQVCMLTCLEEAQSPPDDYCLRARNVSVVGIRPLANGSRVRRYVSAGVAMLETAVRLPRLIRMSDYIHPRLPSPIGTVGALLTRFTRKPVFFYVSTDWETALQSRGRPALAAAVQRVLRFLVRQRLCFTAGWPLATKFGGPNEHVVPVMTTAIDRGHVTSMNEAVDRAKRSPREVLFVGDVWKMKGVHVLLEAVAQLWARGLTPRLRIIGRVTDEGRWLNEAIAKLALQHAVRYDPYMAWDALMREYERSDVFVMPSLQGRGETGPKVVLEAMARGVPVIASKVGFVPNVVRHLENGWIVSPDSSTEVADAVQRLWVDAEMRMRFAANGVRTALRYDLDTVIDDMVGKVSRLQGSRRTTELMESRAHRSSGFRSL